MPELPEVETAVRSLRKNLERKVITSVSVLKPYPLKYNSPEDLEDSVLGKRITSIDRRGKYILLTLESVTPSFHYPTVLMVHLGMTGALIYKPSDRWYHAYPPTICNHIFLEFHLDDGGILFFSDYRRFGSVRAFSLGALFNPDTAPAHLKGFLELGVEPFEPGAEEKFLTAVRQSRYAYKPIKGVLLDQRVVAGIGNIYASEACFAAGVNPHRSVHTLSDDELRAIFRSSVEIMAKSIELGGSSIKDYVDGEGVSGSFQHHLKVYAQSFCPSCNSQIVVTTIDDRATFHCPQCQS